MTVSGCRGNRPVRVKSRPSTGRSAENGKHASVTISGPDFFGLRKPVTLAVRRNHHMTDFLERAAVFAIREIEKRTPMPAWGRFTPTSAVIEEPPTHRDTDTGAPSAARLRPLKIAVLAPIPIASVRTATAVKPGIFARRRRIWFKRIALDTRRDGESSCGKAFRTES